MTKIDSDHSMQNWRRYCIHETFIFFQNEKSHALNYANSCNPNIDTSAMLSHPTLGRFTSQSQSQTVSQSLMLVPPQSQHWLSWPHAKCNAETEWPLVITLSWMAGRTDLQLLNKSHRSNDIPELHLITNRSNSPLPEVAAKEMVSQLAAKQQAASTGTSSSTSIFP